MVHIKSVLIYLSVDKGYNTSHAMWGPTVVNALKSFCGECTMFFLCFLLVSTARPGGIGDIQKSSPSNITLVLSWEPPASPNGVILNYLVRIINLSDGRIVSEDS